MKAAYEHVEFGGNCSVRVYHRRLPRIPFEWHHHPEYELTLTMNSHGKRYIGDSVATYGSDDLVLVPPDLPHTWASNRSIEPSLPQVAIVIWFDGEWDTDNPFNPWTAQDGEQLEGYLRGLDPKIILNRGRMLLIAAT